LNELHVIPDGAVLIRDGVILEVGPSRRLENLAAAKGADEIDACGRVVMPAFVDSHTHLAVPLTPGDDEEIAHRVRGLSGQRIEARTRSFVDAMARHGTATVEAKTGTGADECAEYKLLRVFSALQEEGPLDVVPSLLCKLPHTGADAALDHFAGELLPRVSRRKAAVFADIACNGEGEHIPCYERYLASASQLGFRRKVHAGSPQVSAAIELAIRHSATSIDHLEYATPEDARRIAAAGIVATVFPISCFQNRGSQPPVRELIAAGAPVAIATNFNPYSPTLNMQTAIALAALHFGMTMEQAISAATINGAHALGRGDRIGSIEPGKSADLIVLNVHDYRELRESLGTNLVQQTMKKGSIIYREGQINRASGLPGRPSQ